MRWCIKQGGTWMSLKTESALVWYNPATYEPAKQPFTSEISKALFKTLSFRLDECTTNQSIPCLTPTPQPGLLLDQTMSVSHPHPLALPSGDPQWTLLHKGTISPWGLACKTAVHQKGEWSGWDILFSYLQLSEEESRLRKVRVIEFSEIPLAAALVLVQKTAAYSNV